MNTINILLMECVSFSLPSFLLLSAPYTQMAEQLPVQAKEKTSFQGRNQWEAESSDWHLWVPSPSSVWFPKPTGKLAFLLSKHDLSISSEAAHHLCGDSTNSCLSNAPPPLQYPFIISFKSPTVINHLFLIFFFLIVQWLLEFYKKGKSLFLRM